MPIPASDDLAERAEALYAERLRQKLEPEHNDEFVVIEPDSGAILSESRSWRTHVRRVRSIVVDSRM